MIGGGDTGSDCVGTAHRQGAACVVQIELLPKPADERTPQYPWPIYPMLLKTSSSHEEGGDRHWAVLTKEFVGKNGKVTKLSCVRVDFSEADASGRPAMKEIPNSKFEIEADMVVLAMGFLHPEKDGVIAELGLEMDQRGNIKTGADYKTSIDGIYAAGDCHRGQSLIVWALMEGRDSAREIDRYLK